MTYLPIDPDAMPVGPYDHIDATPLPMPPRAAAAPTVCPDCQHLITEAAPAKGALTGIAVGAVVFLAGAIVLIVGAFAGWW